MAIRRPRAPLRLSTARQLPGGVLAPIAGLRNVVVPISDGGGGDGAAAPPYVPSPIVHRTVTGTAGDNADAATAFNALAPSLPPTTTSSVTFLHKGTDAYLYEGARGTSITAATAANFRRLGATASTERYYETVLVAGALDTVTLPFTVTDAANSEVYFGGNRLPKTAYTLVGNTLTFTFNEFPREAGDRWSGQFVV